MLCYTSIVIIFFKLYNVKPLNLDFIYGFSFIFMLNILHNHLQFLP